MFTEHFASLRAKLCELADLPHGWNGYGAPPPGPVSLRNAALVIDRAEAALLMPERVVADADGGACVYFIVARRIAGLYCMNDGTVVASMSYRRKGDPSEIWELAATVGDVDDAIARIRAFFAADDAE